MKKGFTMIEVLAVVLIIGILAAVAVPQYQKAVKKSKLSALLPLGKTILHALEVNQLAGGTGDWDELGLDMPSGYEKFWARILEPKNPYNKHIWWEITGSGQILVVMTGRRIDEVGNPDLGFISAGNGRPESIICSCETEKDFPYCPAGTIPNISVPVSIPSEE